MKQPQTQLAAYSTPRFSKPIAKFLRKSIKWDTKGREGRTGGRGRMGREEFDK